MATLVLVLLSLFMGGCSGEEPGPTTSPTPGTPTPAPVTPTPAPVTSAPTPVPTPGLCPLTTGDDGGARLSYDAGMTLQPNAHPQLSSGDFTWDVDYDPADPNTVWELWTDTLYVSPDGGCSFHPAVELDQAYTHFHPGPPGSDLYLLSSYAVDTLLVSRDGAQTWTPEVIPYPVFDVAISPDQPEQWTLGGRNNCLYVRDTPQEKWTCRPVSPMPSELADSLDWADGTWGTWMVADYFGLYRTTNRGETWEVETDGLDTTLDGEEVLGYVAASISMSHDGRVAYAAINTITLHNSERAIWRWEEDTHHWEKRVSERDTLEGEPIVITGATRVFVDPRDPDTTLFVFGSFFEGSQSDIYRSRDGLHTLEVSNFRGFDLVLDVAFSPYRAESLVIGVSTNTPSE